MRVLLTGGWWASCGLASHVPVAIWCFLRFVGPARQILLMDALSDELLAQLFLVGVLPVSSRLALGFGFAEAWRNGFTLFVLLAARHDGQCKKHNQSETLHVVSSTHKSGCMVCW